MAKKKKLALPDDFSRIMRGGDPDKIKEVFKDEALSEHLIKSSDWHDNPLYIYSPCTEIYKWFVERGFDIAMNSVLGQPIHEHARSSHNNIEGIIQAGGDIEVRHKGSTPLLCAAERKQPSSMRVLIEHGADIHARQDDTGEDALETVLFHWNHDAAQNAAECAVILKEAGTEVTDKIREKIAEICADFERRKEEYRSYLNNKQAFEDGMTRMCTVFGVEKPLPEVQGETPPITVTSTDWRKQHEELWNMLVPPQGKCKTVQGEVVRIGGRINDEIFNSGGAHWDKDFRAMLNALKGYYEMGTIPDEEEHQEALALIKSIGKNSGGDDVLRLCEINVHWVLANPEPIPLGEVNYKR